MRKRFIITSTIVLLTVSGCSSSRYSMSQDRAPDTYVNVNNIPDAVPRAEPRSKYGNPGSYVVNGKRYFVKTSSHGYSQRGIASWYGKKFHGHRTSSGETYDMYKMTAAHKTLPLPTYVEVRNLDNNRSVIVKVNDRGPFHDNRLIDLSYAAARKLGITARGTGAVEIRAIDPAEYNRLQYVKNSPPREPAVENAEKFELYLQVGAFVSRNNAEQLRSRLQDEMHSINIKTGYSKDKNIYRVRIGPLQSVEDADRLASKIASLGFNPPHIVLD